MRGGSGAGGFGRIAGMAFEIAAAEVTSSLKVANHGSVEDRRRSSRSMQPNMPRFYPEMKTRRGFFTSCPR